MGAQGPRSLLDEELGGGGYYGMITYTELGAARETREEKMSSNSDVGVLGCCVQTYRLLRKEFGRAWALRWFLLATWQCWDGGALLVVRRRLFSLPTLR